MPDSMRKYERQIVFLDNCSQLLGLHLTVTLTSPPGCLIPTAQVAVSILTLLESACPMSHHLGLDSFWN